MTPNEFLAKRLPKQETMTNGEWVHLLKECLREYVAFTDCECTPDRKCSHCWGTELIEVAPDWSER